MSGLDDLIKDAAGGTGGGGSGISSAGSRAEAETTR